MSASVVYLDPKKETFMLNTFKHIKNSAVAGVLAVTSLVSPLHAQMSESLFELANFGVTMGNFTNSLNQLLHSR